MALTSALELNVGCGSKAAEAELKLPCGVRYLTLPFPCPCAERGCKGSGMRCFECFRRGAPKLAVIPYLSQLSLACACSPNQVAFASETCHDVGPTTHVVLEHLSSYPSCHEE